MIDICSNCGCGCHCGQSCTECYDCPDCDCKVAEHKVSDVRD